MISQRFLAILALIFGIAHAASGSAADAAPDFALKSTHGDNLRLSEHRGEVVLLNFWASWCGPCRQEMPILNTLHQRYNKLGFSVIGVNVDKDSNLADKLLKDIPVTFTVLLDNTGAVSSSYNISAMPTSVLIDRDGNMRFLHKGYKPGYEQDYENEIKELIRE
ncbi:MAG TPA: TlpA disulfide reductase family protein [Spongiibacteraceae bacterium]|nr:TlpA disulfide reductase family protein [Spongiibacteraceae bacterium]